MNKENSLKILLIDGSEAEYKSLSEVLSRSRDNFELVRLPDIPDEYELNQIQPPDAVLLELNLRNTSGLATFDLAFSRLKDIPIIVLSDVNDESLALETVKRGAQDYVIKEHINPAMLSRILRYALERHRVMAELSQTRLAQLEMKDRFLSHVSHELRTPLASIYQFITIIQDGIAGPIAPSQQEYLDIILRNIVQLKTMIDDLLEATRANTSKLTINPTEIVPCEIIADGIGTLAATARAKGISLTAEVADSIPNIFADGQRARGVLINLIDNAIKFTNSGGAITVRARIFEKNPAFVRFSVSDTGVGIEPEEVDKIFEYLYQAESTLESSRKGLGLGLYICKTLVNLHGGEIWVISKPGYGSTFCFTLPVYRG